MSETPTGHKLELSDATAALADAIAAGDTVALRKAAGDHASALNSQATAMAASIAVPVYTKLESVATQIHELARIVTNARQHDLNWRTEERTRRDTQHDRLYSELDKLIAASEETARGLGKLEARLDVDERRLDSKRARIEALETDVAALKEWIALLEQLAAERGG